MVWTLQAILILILVGAVAGWLAGMIVRGYGLGLVGNVVVGILGAFLFTWLAPMLHISIPIENEIIGRIVYALIGAVILLLLAGLVRRAR